MEPLCPNLLAERRDVKRQSLIFLTSLRVSRECIRQLRLGDVPEVRLSVFLELVLPLQVVLAECDPEHSQYSYFCHGHFRQVIPFWPFLASRTRQFLIHRSHRSFVPLAWLAAIDTNPSIPVHVIEVLGARLQWFSRLGSGTFRASFTKPVVVAVYDQIWISRFSHTIERVPCNLDSSNVVCCLLLEGRIRLAIIVLGLDLTKENAVGGDDLVELAFADRWLLSPWNLALVLESFNESVETILASLRELGLEVDAFVY